MPVPTQPNYLVDSLITHPTSLDEISELCRNSDKLLPVGGQTKAALLFGHEPGSDVTRIDMRGYSGVVTYDPSEFLITARAGTTLEELTRVLRAQGQYLPYDPVWIAQGSTLGGSIASGISGPCRLLYGSLRDFLMEVALCDSAGHEVRGGGKVVKNAAGFDLPKLVVGSYGRMGIITEATLKVFPEPQGWLTLAIDCGSLRAAIEQSMKLLSMPLPIAAIEIEQQSQLLVRLAGPLDSLDGMAGRIKSQLPLRMKSTAHGPGDSEQQMWRERAEYRMLQWEVGGETDSAADSLLIRVAIVHHQCLELAQALSQWNTEELRMIFSCGATVAWIALRSHDLLPALNDVLTDQKLSGVVVRGTQKLTLLGDVRWTDGAARIQSALDVHKKYLAYV